MINKLLTYAYFKKNRKLKMSDVNSQVRSDAAASQRSPAARRPAPAMTLPDAPSTRQWSPRRTRHAHAPLVVCSVHRGLRW